MSYQNLPTEAMLQISGAWLEERQLQTLLTEVSILASFTHQLRRRHDDLVIAQSTISNKFNESKALVEESQDLDDVHDNVARGVYHTFSGFIALAKGTPMEATLEALRDRIFLHGLSITRRSLREQAGYAQALKQRLTEQERQLLATLPTPSGSLDDHLQRWLQAGARLGEIEDRRAVLAEELKGVPVPLSQNQARRSWIRSANLFVDLIEDLHETAQLSTALRQQLLLPLEAALQRVRRA
jgi:hypothetical protein